MPRIVSLLIAYTLTFNLKSSYCNYGSQKRMAFRGENLSREEKQADRKKITNF